MVTVFNVGVGGEEPLLLYLKSGLPLLRNSRITLRRYIHRLGRLSYLPFRNVSHRERVLRLLHHYLAQAYRVRLFLSHVLIGAVDELGCLLLYG